MVTGAAGFIGSYLCEELIKKGHTVIGIDNLSTGKIENLEALKSEPRFEFAKRDILEARLKNAKVDWVFHLAARADVVPSIKEPELYHFINVSGTVQVLEFARRSGAKKFIYAASSSCYGDNPKLPTKEYHEKRPKYPYALTKYLGEQYARHWQEVYKLPVTSLRLFNVYGPRARSTGAYGAVFGVFLSQIANDQPLTIIGDGEQKRDFTYVRDVARAFIIAAESESTGIFNVGTGKAHSINYLASLLGRDPKKPGHVDYIPDRPGEPRVTQADISAISDLGWEPTVSFEGGVKIMLKHLMEFKNAPLWDKNSIAKATETWFEYMT